MMTENCLEGDEIYDSVEDCHTINIASLGEEGGDDSKIDKKRDTIETKSGCVSNQNLEELVNKLQTLQNNLVGDLEDIANNLTVVRDQFSHELEKSLSRVKTTAEADMER